MLEKQKKACLTNFKNSYRVLILLSEVIVCTKSFHKSGV